ncbi:MAG TPA: RNB domain-containing ribonuclease [Thermoanaerobaculia bacterium]|nr:RNB domain-containing ribonuclease [Thermoanaerobaculia bacterium]
MADLGEIARRALIERDFQPDFPAKAREETRRIVEKLSGNLEEDDGAYVHDLRELFWFSIDNVDTRDLDQLSFAEGERDGDIRLRVAIADVSVLVRPGSAIDQRAYQNTTSIYTPAGTFPMLPKELSEGLTSLHEGEDRLAVVVDMTVDDEGSVKESEVYRAWVRNHQRLVYQVVGAWLEDESGMPGGRIGEQLRLHDQVTERLRKHRHERGALRLETIEARPVFQNGVLTDLAEEEKDRAKELIEDVMIAANGVTATFLENRGLPSLRRLVRSPARWPRIVVLAKEHGTDLPAEPDPAALNAFLEKSRAADPDKFPELSLSVVKLLGSGEYTVDVPGRPSPGHFGLAADDYTHSTAPNRRYPDLAMQRLLKAALANQEAPYNAEELEEIARHCTEREDEAKKVERLVRKSAAAMLLQSRTGDWFNGVVTGASDKGTWVRVFHPSAEGRLERGSQGLDVGDRVRVRLDSVDVGRGFIDFVR